MVLEWQAQALARGLAQGRDQGLAEGRDEVRAEMLELLRENVLGLLRTKSQTELPRDLVAAVQGQTDPAMLRQWFDRALKADSLEEVRSAFNRF